LVTKEKIDIMSQRGRKPMVDDDEIFEVARDILNDQPIFRSEDIVENLDVDYHQNTITNRLARMSDDYPFLKHVKVGSGKAWYLEITE